ncbi:MAG: hypothetical protein ACI81F_002680, partial [Thalassolituus oleivorans]
MPERGGIAWSCGNESNSSYTSYDWQSMLKAKNLIVSLSRRG